MYDRPAAIGVLQAHVAQHPDDRLARLRLSALALESERYELVTSDPSQLPPVEEAPPATVGRLVVGVLERSGRWRDALAFAYDLLRRNFGDPDAHGLYCALVLHGERDGQVVAASDTVQPGMAVAYREDGEASERWVVVEDNAPQAQLDEYPTGHPRVQRMLGLGVGDKFVLSTMAVQKRHAEIVQIVGKYVFRFRDSMDQFQARFPDREDFQQVRLAPAGGTEADLDPTPILASLEARRRYVLQVRETYARQPTPLHCFAKAVGRHLFEALHQLTTDPDAGVRWCCQGTEEERQVARRAARDYHEVVLDLSALFAVWRLNLSELRCAWRHRRLLVTQSTFDRLRAIVKSESDTRVRGHMTAGERGGLAIYEVSEAQRAASATSLQALLRFVRECCAVVPAPEMAALESERRERYIELFGRGGLESVLVGARPGHLLWSDDLTLGMVAREDFASERRVWTQVLLHTAVDEGVLSQADFDKHSARLIAFGYSFTWCSPGIIHQAGEMVTWSSESWPLWQVIRQFGSPMLHPQMKVELAAHAIVGVSRSVASPFAREAFIRAILNRLGSRGLAKHLAVRVGVLCGLDIVTAAEALDVIRSWLSGLLILP